MRLDTEFLRLPLRFDVDRLRAEVEAIPASAWRPHPQGFAGNSAVILVSANGEENDDLAGPMRSTPTLLGCPYLMQVLASFGTVIGRSRLMRIESEGRVPPHADVAYYWSKRVRIHVPVVTNPAVRFVCAGKPVHMGAGEAWIFDNWKQHWVENEADHARVHLVADTLGSDDFWRLTERADRPFDRECESTDERQHVPFDPAAVADLRTEREESWLVMPLDEARRIVDFLVKEVRESDRSPEEDRRRFEEATGRFLAAWRRLHSGRADPTRGHHVALQELWNRVSPLAGRIRLASNGVDPVGALRAHLLENAVRQPTKQPTSIDARPRAVDVPQALQSAAQLIGRGQLDVAERRLQVVLSADPSQTDALHLSGVVLLKKGQAHAAIERFREAIRILPERAEFHGNLGVAWLGQDRLPEARAAFERAIELAPEYPEAFDNLGLVHGRLGEHAEAVVCHERAVRLRPAFGTAWLHLARGKERLGDDDGAETAYRRAVATGTKAAQDDLAAFLARTGRSDEAQRRSGGPATAEDWNRLGVTLGRQGKRDEARDAFEKALALAPDDADLLNNVGTTLADDGRFDEAAERFEQATRANPRQADAWSNLGRVRERLGRHDEARMAYERLVELRPGDVRGHVRLGVCCEMTENWERARAVHERAVHLDESSAPGWAGLARVLDHEGRHDEAIAAGRSAVKGDEHSADARHLLGTLLARDALDRRRPKSVNQHRLRIEEAASMLQAANELDPRAKTDEVLGTLLYRLDRFDESTEAFERAVAADDSLVESLDGLGNAHLDAGRFAEAADCFRRAVERRPTFGRPHFHLLRAERRRDDEARRTHLARVCDLLDRDEELTNNDRVHLHFAAATLHEELGEADRAFAHFQRGNDAKPRPERSQPFDEIVDRAIAVFDETYFERHAVRGSDSERPVFVVGMPRSGTTLVEQILASHPRIAGAGELVEIGAIADLTIDFVEPRTEYPSSLGGLDADQLGALATRYLELLSQYDAEADRVTDKMPTNFLHLGLIALLFPRATVIRCRRDPRDVCVSCFRQNLDWPFCDLVELGRYHRAYERLSEHWQRVLPLTVHEVVYEELVRDLEGHARQLVAATGLDWDERCARFHENDRAVRTPSKAQVRQPVYTSSIGRWQTFEPHLTALLEILSG